MRTIQQAPAPHSFLQWQRAQKSARQNLSYANLPADIKNDIKVALLHGQGGLCAYTLRKLATQDDCHIEHLVPQNQAAELGLTYNNMLACFPADGGDTNHGYGAPMKGGTAVAVGENFVSPYSSGCDQRFQFDSQGLIDCAPHDKAAQQTIDCLRLNHGQLVELRQRALSAHGVTLRTSDLRSQRYPRLQKASCLLSAKQAQSLASMVMQADAQGQLEPFCSAIAQVAAAYAQRESARALRLKNFH
jgi:uncharacterized protein (TIGR02646 family)